jgi:ACS family glucarate transporter-like MFS transporter
MFLGILINYLDRVNISQSIIVITKGFRLSDLQKGWVLSAFAIGYVAMMMVGGYAVFKLGARVALTISMLLLSVASVCCGLSFSFFTLLLCRLLVGIFEAPVYPAFASISGIWFPKQERVKAIGFFDIGSYVGVGFATLVIVLLITYFNWRVSFIFSGLLTLLWAVTWFYYYRDTPATHPSITKAELLHITQGVQQEKPRKISWVKYLGNRKVIGISIGFFCFNYLKSFYLTWLPTYMVEAKGIKLLSFGLVGSIPIVFAIAGEIFTAYMMDKLIAKGNRATLVKKTPICLGMILSTIIIFSLFTASAVLILVLLTLSYIFLVSASVGIWSIPEELAASKKEISIIGSIQNTFSNIAGIIAPVVTGYFYGRTNSFLIPFVISIIVSLVGSLSYWKIAGELTFITFNKSITATKAKAI